MKRIIYIIGLALMAASCVKEGPQGPAGPTGTAGIAGIIGKDGVNGTNGTNGVDGAKGTDGTKGADGTATCSVCHSNDAKLYTAQLQYNNSVHAEGATAGSENRADCSGCHNNEGFVQRIADGKFSLLPATGYSNVTPISCYTCHNIHTAYDKTDYAFKSVAPVICLADSSATINKGNSNLCINCHQSRALSVVFKTVKTYSKLKDADDTVVVKLTSGRLGPHHGPQGNLLNGTAGSGAYEIAGSMGYANSTHASASNCIQCHMGSSAAGVMAGGHSLNVSYLASATATTKTLNQNACATCHSTDIAAKTLAGTPTAKYETSQAAVANLLASLKTILGKKGWLDTVPANTSTYDLLIGANKKGLSATNVLYLTAAQVKVFYNYKFIEEDRSLGMHNPSYAKALLQNSIELAKTW
jgi:hypothetical protein